MESSRKQKNKYLLKSLNIEHIGGKDVFLFYGKMNDHFYFSYANNSDQIVVFDKEPFTKEYIRNCDNWELVHYVEDLDITQNPRFYKQFHKFIDILIKDSFYNKKFHCDIKNFLLKKLQEKNVDYIPDDKKLDDLKEFYF